MRASADFANHLEHKLFEPFVTTKVDSGTGLGLWVSSEIVRKHDGDLRFRSRLGSDTVFSVFRPLELPSFSNHGSI